MLGDYRRGVHRRSCRVALALMLAAITGCSGRKDSPQTATLIFGANASNFERNRQFVSSLQEQIFTRYNGEIFIQTNKLTQAQLNLDAFRKSQELSMLLVTTREAIRIFMPQENPLKIYCSIIEVNKKKRDHRNLPDNLSQAINQEGWSVLGALIGDAYVVAAPTSAPTTGSGYRMGLSEFGPDPALLAALGLAPAVTSVKTMPMEFGRNRLDRALLHPLQITPELIKVAPELHPAGLEVMPRLVLVREEVKQDLGKTAFQSLKAAVKTAIGDQHYHTWNTHREIQVVWRDWGAKLHRTPLPLSLKPVCAELSGNY